MLVPRVRLQKFRSLGCPIRISLFGATGSIGTSTLELVRHNPELFTIHSLVVNRSVEALVRLAHEFKPRFIAAADFEAAKILSTAALPPGVSIVSASEIEALAADPDADVVLAAIVGAVGIRSVMSALRAGKKVALANKESLVVAGSFVGKVLEGSGATIIPVDSEHSAIFQALQGQHPELISKLVLTASGGPFLKRSLGSFDSITPEEAVKHPKWNMGKKISVDSASMMNKALELIEAYWLFGVPAEQIEVVVHPQSIVHSAVSFNDGSTIAQMSHPDMKGPISYALLYPEGRVAGAVPSLQLAQVGQLDFFELDSAKFPAVALARQSLKLGVLGPALFNLANEIAVEAFLSRLIRFTDISVLVSEVLSKVPAVQPQSLEELLQNLMDTENWIRQDLLAPLIKKC
jgi:1-deoxy-D-xylulose-5-phosphate reductoisomerase